MSDVFKRFLKLESASGIILILAALCCHRPGELGPGATLSELPQYRGAGSHRGARHQQAAAALDQRWLHGDLLPAGRSRGEARDAGGALSSRVQATFPAIAAVGGMLAPASSIASSTTETRPPGWLGHPGRNRHRLRPRGDGAAGQAGTDQPQGLPAGLAIMDDLGSSSSSPCSSTQQLSLTALAIGVVATLTLLWMNRRGEDRIGPTCWWAWCSGSPCSSPASMRPWPVGGGGLHDPLNGKRYASPLKHLEHVLHPGAPS